MKIFHGPIEIAGQMGILCGELKRRGHIAVGYNHYHTYLGYKDHLINITRNELENLSKHIINFFDVFHYHYSDSILSEFTDISQIHALGKKMIMHHWGNDVRFHEQAKSMNPFVNTEDSPPNEIIHQRLKKISHYIKEAIVQDYEVYS